MILYFLFHWVLKLYFLGLLLEYKILHLPVTARWIIVGFTSRAMKWPTALKQPKCWFLKQPHCFQCGIWWITAGCVSVFPKMLIYDSKFTHIHTYTQRDNVSKKGFATQREKENKYRKEDQPDDHRKIASDLEAQWKQHQRK